MLKRFFRWSSALQLRPSLRSVTITSWNEWGEGTQIEPAVAVMRPDGICASAHPLLQMSINISQLEPDRALALSTRHLLRLNVETSPDGNL